MKKDKEWLKGLINEEGIVMDMNLLGRHDEQYWKNENIKINKGRLFYLIDQLDEPEVLSQEFIDEHEQCITGYGAHKYGMTQYHHTPFVSVCDLQNLLVPKQNKPVIPQFVVDYYNDYKNYELTFAEWFEFPESEREGKTEDKTFEWLLDNSHEVNIERQFILADIIAHGLDGYEVEKEKKYLVKLPHESDLGLPLYLSRQFGVEWVDEETMADHITEAEIKAIDERYIPFMVPVDEVNNE